MSMFLSINCSLMLGDYNSRSVTVDSNYVNINNAKYRLIIRQKRGGV